MLCEALHPKKEFHSTLVKERMRKIKDIICLNRTVREDEFFRATYVAQIKNFKLTKDAYISEDHVQKFADLNKFSMILQK